MAKVKYKVTIWREMDVPDELTDEQALEIVKKYEDPNDIYEDFCDKTESYETPDEFMLNTEEYMTVEENGYQPTIEYHNDKGEIIWTNNDKNYTR